MCAWQRLSAWTSGDRDSGRRPRISRPEITAPRRQCVPSDHEPDLRSIAEVEVVAQGAQFALLGIDLVQPAGIGVCRVQHLGRRFGPVGQKCAQNVLRDFEADAVGEGVVMPCCDC